MHFYRYLAIVCVIVSIFGCRESLQRPKMTIHIHDGQYDFIDFNNVVVESANDIESFEKIILKPEFHDLIQYNLFVLRYAEEQSPTGLGAPEDVSSAMVKMTNAGVTYFGLDIVDELSD